MPANSARQLDLGTSQDGYETLLKRRLIAFGGEIRVCFALEQAWAVDLTVPLSRVDIKARYRILSAHNKG